MMKAIVTALWRCYVRKKEAADRSHHEQDKKRKAEESARQVEAKVKELEIQDK